MTKHHDTPLSPYAIQGLLSSLKEVQDTVRAYDTKAQIVGVGFIFSLGIISDFAERFTLNTIGPQLWVVLLSWFLLVGPIVLFGAVLYPSRTISPIIGEKINALKHVYYYRPSSADTMREYINDIHSSDWVSEIAYEIMKLSVLREVKRRRFLTALWATCLAYLALISFQLIRFVRDSNLY